MKKLILLFSLLAFTVACSSDDETTTTKNEGRVLFTSHEKYNLQSGEEKERSKDIHLLYVWKADGKDFDLYTNSVDILGGELLDKKTGKSEKYYASAYKTDVFGSNLSTGKYVMVVYYADTNKSYTYFDIKEGETTTLKKYYKPTEVGQQYSPW